MLELNTLCMELFAQKTFTLNGIPYYVKNCVAAADGNVLKANLCLASGDAIDVVVSVALKVLDQSLPDTAYVTKIVQAPSVEQVIITSKLI